VVLEGPDGEHPQAQLRNQQTGSAQWSI
jgi:hypothetical protein